MQTRRRLTRSAANSTTTDSLGKVGWTKKRLRKDSIDNETPEHAHPSVETKQQVLSEDSQPTPTESNQQVLSETTNHNLTNSADESDACVEADLSKKKLTPESERLSPSSDHSNQENVLNSALREDRPIAGNSATEADAHREASSGASALNNIIADVVSKHIKEEEDKLQKLSSEKEAKETSTFMQEWEKAEEEQKEERYQKLQLLLTKSEMYTKYLLGRMEEQKKRMMTPAEDSESVEGGPPAKKRRKKKSESNQDSSMASAIDSLDSSQLSQYSEAEVALCSGCPILFTGQLRPYQVDGLLWLNTMFENGVNGILADEMGLGKTIQCIAAIAHLITMNIRGPYLIVVPLSTLPNWVNEFKRFAPKVPVMLYHGSKPEREVLRKGVYKSKEVDGQWWTQPVVCTSYEVAMADRQYLMHMHWKYLIVDEGHRIKNAQCRLIKELRMYDSTHRVLLTGTPLQNNLSELWSLLNFLLPEVFDDLDSFEYWFKLDCLRKDQQDQLIAEEKKRNILSMLHKIMTPFILRRLKSDVELNLPPKQELLVYAPLSQQQRKLYEAVVDRTVDKLLNKGDDSMQSNSESLIIPTPDNKRSRRSSSVNQKVNYTSQLDAVASDDEDLDAWAAEVMELTARRDSNAKGKRVKKLGTHVNNIKLLNPMMMLRKCCSHPYLISQPIDPETGYCKIDEEVVNCSGKMLLMDAMLKELKRHGHKVLIFSQMTKMLDLIEDFCHLRQFDYCRLDGMTDINSRREQMESFNTDPEKFLFLLSTRAGGLGINLSSADTVIIFDSDWNPQCDLQAQDRAHRIGQTKPVLIYRLVCANTVDEKIVERATRKRRLEKMVIHKEKFKTGMTQEYAETCKPITSQELLDLLKSHDHDAVINVANGRRDVLSKKEMAALLDRSHLVQQWEENKKRGESGTAGKTKSKEKASAGKTNHSSPGMRRVFKVIDDEVEGEM